MVWFAWLACADETTDPAETGAENVATALGDCDGAFRDPGPYPNQLVAGTELERVTLDAPGAVCDDGTPAVMYVRPATEDALADSWSIHVQGGGGCASWEDCAIRWCGAGYYDASKMSSDWAADAIDGFGIYDANGANQLAGANHAFLYYCSSDSWGGAAEVTYTPEDPAAGAPFTMLRHGHAIFEAAIAALEDGATSVQGTAMPSLTDAAAIVLSGTSAGSTGARRHADWLSDRLAANGTAVVGLFDAAIVPARESLPAGDGALHDQLYQTIYDLDHAEDPPPYYDESCVSTLAGTDDAFRCADDTYVMMNHITTPFFVRQDLQDTTGIADLFGVPLDDNERAVAETLRLVSEIQGTALETIPVAPGVYGPNCAQHVALETNDWWRVATVEDAYGTPFTFQGAALAWYLGDAPVVLVDDPVIGEGAGPRSTCAATY